MPLSHLFVVIMVASLFSFGGLGSLPVLQSQLSANGVSPDLVVLPSLAVGNISPGPNGLYLIAASYFIGGITGSLVACAAVVVPPFLVIGRRAGPTAAHPSGPVPRHAAIARARGGRIARRHRLVAGQARRHRTTGRWP